jgi:general secretion pathway protein C
MATDRGFGHSVFLGEGAASGAAPRRAPAVLAVLLWLVAGLSMGYWLLQVLGRSPLTPVAASAQLAEAPDPAALARVLGAAPQAALEAAGPVVAPPLSSRFQLLGVVADRADGGAALIAIDGQPPKPYRVGATLEGGVVLQAVQRRSVRLVPPDAGQAFELSLPEAPSTPS